MTWGPEDWDTWTPEVSAHPAGIDEPVRLMQRTLLRIPGRRRKTVGDIGCGMGTMLPFLAAHFGRVVAVEPRTDVLDDARDRCEGLLVEFRRRPLDDLEPLRGRLHIAVAIDSIVGGEAGVDVILSQIHGCLIEGGVMLATFPATERRGAPYRMSLGDADRREASQLHEVELQYRLRRAGFRGMRMRRFRGDGVRPDTLLCMAARRANN